MFRELIVLDSEWDRDFVRKVLRRNLGHGRRFVVSSGEASQREVVRSYLAQYTIPYAFIQEEGEYLWKCVVGFFESEDDSITYIEGDAPPEVVRA